MITTILITSVLLWFVLLNVSPRLFHARKRPKPVRTQYSYNVCGDDPMPTRKKKKVSPMRQGVGQRS
jgi:hypothetical protein